MDAKIYETLTEPARPIPLGRPDDYQSFGGAGLIHPTGSPYIYGKDVPLGSRIKITTTVEVVPPTCDDIALVLSKWLPPIDAPVRVVTPEGDGFYNCQLCQSRIKRGAEYYKFGGFNAHKSCVDERRARYSVK